MNRETYLRQRITHHLRVAWAHIKAVFGGAAVAPDPEEEDLDFRIEDEEERATAAGDTRTASLCRTALGHGPGRDWARAEVLRHIAARAS